MAFTTSSTFDSIRITFQAQSNRIVNITARFDGDNPSPTSVRITFRRGYNVDHLTCYGASTS